MAPASRHKADQGTTSGRRDEYTHLAPLFVQLADDSVPATKRSHIRAQLITGHLPVAEHIARRFRDRGQSTDDLTQVATVGLINAVDRFEPGRGSEFLVFAIPTITGEIQRYFRDSTWALRVPRKLKELYAEVNASATRLGQDLGRAARPSEIAADLDIPLNEVLEGLQVGASYRSSPLDSTADDPGSVVNGMGMTDPELATVDDRALLTPVLARLPKRDAAILVMRFFGQMTQTQIATRMGISQMHVSRLLSNSLQTLREALRDESTATA
jgi:RNA polymerase sigma-B factor